MELLDRALDLLAIDSEIEGEIRVSGTIRIHGTIKGAVIGNEDSEIILCESGYVKGEVRGSKVIIDGYVEGKVFATKSLVLARHGRVRGSLDSPSLMVEPGSFFEGSAKTVQNKKKEPKIEPSSASEEPQVSP